MWARPCRLVEHLKARTLLSDRSLVRIAGRVGPWLSTPHRGAQNGRWVVAHGAAQPTLGPGIPIWVIGFNTMLALRQGRAAELSRFRVMELAENTRCWHLQIKRNETKAVGFAEAADTSPLGSDEVWAIHRMGLLPIAAREFDSGLARFTKLSGKTWQMAKLRLLKVPGVDLGVFWSEASKADRLLVFHKPKGRTAFAVNRLYDWPAFAAILGAGIHTLVTSGSGLGTHTPVAVTPREQHGPT
jgi:hypothetical protein